MKYLMVGIHGCHYCEQTNTVLSTWCAENGHRFEHNYLSSLTEDWQFDLMHLAEMTRPNYLGNYEPMEDGWVLDLEGLEEELGVTFTDDNRPVPRTDFAMIPEFRLTPQVFKVEEDGDWRYVGGSEEVEDLCGE